MTLALLLAVVLPVGNKPQFLWDDYLVNTNRTTATLVPHQAEFAGTIMLFDRRWEGDSCDFFNILEDQDEKGKLYRMYYLAWHLFNKPGEPVKYAEGRRVCYVESRDGIHWERPSLGICEFEGSKDNNIICDAHTLTADGVEAELWDNFTVLKDPRPDCPKDELYKGTGLTLQWDKDRNDWRNAGIQCWKSPDGIHFTPAFKLASIDPSGGIWGDSLNVIFWDAKRKEWQFYGRSSHVADPDQDREGRDGVRDVMFSSSKDFHKWTMPVRIDFGPNAETYGLYTSNAEPYFRDPEIVIGFPTRYVERLEWNASFERLCGLELRTLRAGEGHRHRYGRAITDCIFMFSRGGGKRFTRIDEAFMRPGPEHPVNWVYGSCYPAYRVTTAAGRRGDDPELSWLVPVGQMCGEAVQMDRYVLRVDGFLSYNAKYNLKHPYKLFTKPLLFNKATEFHMNFSTSARGGIYVKLHSCDGRTISSCEQFGDSIDRIVDFNGKVSSFAGKPCVIEFSMSDADLYSFQFK